MACPSCANENPPESAYCGTCGRSLGLRAPSDYTPRHLTERILASRSALEGERKQVTVLFADVKGSTALAESMGAEKWHRLLDELFRILAGGVHRYEGSVNQYTGDGIMALFGAPLAHEDHARRACEAALYIADGLATFTDGLARRGIEIGVRMGLHSGEVVVGKIGDDLRMDYTAQGATVAMAARIEELAEPGHICVSEATAALAEAGFDWIELGSHALRGFAKPSRVLELRRGGTRGSRLDLAGPSLSPLVGRKSELQALRGSLRDALGGNGQVVRLRGEAGLGKSRLCLELLRHCEAENVRATEASCPSHGRGLPYLLARLLLRALFGLEEGDDEEAARSAVERRLVELGGSFTPYLGLLFELLEIEAPRRGPPLAAEERQRALLQLTARLVQSWSAAVPLVLIIDDVHWIDPESERLVNEMVDALGWTHTLLVLSGRPEYELPGPRVSYLREIELAPLADAHARELLDGLLGDDPSLAGLHERILERSGGNPFFLEELVRSLAQRGEIEGEPGAYRQVGEAPDLELPDSVSALLAARIDRLGEREKLVLRVASAIGHLRDPALLARVCELRPDDVEAALAALEQGGLISDGRFAHPLAREVADQSQLEERRCEIHARVAGALEALHPGDLGRQAELIAHHWHAAGEPKRAQRWQRRAALFVENIQVRRVDRGC